MKIERTLPTVTELKLICVAFEETQAAAVVQLRGEGGIVLHTLTLKITDKQSTAIRPGVGGSYETMFIGEFVDTPGLFTALSAWGGLANAEAILDDVAGLFPKS